MQNKSTPPHTRKDIPPPLPPDEGGNDDLLARADHGEGSYTGTRDYQASVKEYLKDADVEADARRAAPTDPEDARLLEEAEAAGKKGPGDGRNKPLDE